MEVLIRNKAVEDFLREVAAAYRELLPAEYEDALALVRQEGHQLINPSGMSTDGHFMMHVQIPARLYQFITVQARKRFGIEGFFRDPKHYELFARCWPDLKVRKRKKQSLIVKFPQEENSV